MEETFTEAETDMHQQSLPGWVKLAQVEAAEAILEKGNVAVCKVSRSGFTTSAIIAAHKRGLKTLVVSPTNKLLEDTVLRTAMRIGGVYCHITGNQSCKYVSRKIGTDRFLREIPIPKGKCSECDSYETCPVTDIERIRNPTLIGMTYAKLEGLSKEEIKRIGEKLSDIDLVIFEEAHTISYPRLPEVDFSVIINWPEALEKSLLKGESEQSEKSALRRVYERFNGLRAENKKYADHFISSADSNHKHAGFQVVIRHPSSWGAYHFQKEQLIEVAENRLEWWPNEDEAKAQVRAIKNVIAIMASETATISGTKNDDAAGKMIITSGQGNIERAIQSFLHEVVPKANVCFVSSTLIESRPGFFSQIADRKLNNDIFPDIHNTNAKMHIHPSTWSFSVMDATDGIKRAVKEIREIDEAVKNQSIYLLAMNESLKNQLKEGLNDCGNIRLDYYRSENTMGTGVPQRIAIAVGLAQTPRHSCDPLAQGDNDLKRYIHSQKLRLNEVHAATWQAWSRVKDSIGLFESQVYCVGVRADEISDAVTWGINRRVTASIDDNGEYHFRVEVDQELDRPIVHAEERTSRGLSRHSISEYTDRVVPAKALIDWRRNSEKSTHIPCSNEDDREDVDNWWNSDSLTLHNHISSRDELEETSTAMTIMFAGRSDCYARKTAKDGGFRKTAAEIDLPNLIMQHLQGSHVIAFYPFDAKDLCYYCAVDVPQREAAMKLSQFLRDNSLPVLVEELATRDAYHIWIPIIPTKTRTVHKFAKQLLHDAEIEGGVVYPRQKSIDSCHKSCGDFLGLPLGMDQENAKLSEFIDPVTFEPVGSVVIKDVLRFREAPESKTTMQSPDESADQEATDDSDAC
jgi:hypothetical protein